MEFHGVSHSEPKIEPSKIKGSQFANGANQEARGQESGVVRGTRSSQGPAVTGGPEAVKRALAERLAIVWADIGPDTMNALIDSMPRRVQLINAKGWYTKY